MDKIDILRSLKDMFDNDAEKEQNYSIETKQIDKANYLSLVANDRRTFIQTHPDYETFLNLLKFHNTKATNYVAIKLNENKTKLFVEFADTEKEKFLDDTRDLYRRLINSNSKNVVIIEDMIVEWVDNLF